jgi:hypothetical protein
MTDLETTAEERASALEKYDPDRWVTKLARDYARLEAERDSLRATHAAEIAVAARLHAEDISRVNAAEASLYSLRAAAQVACNALAGMEDIFDASRFRAAKAALARLAEVGINPGGAE